MNPTDDILKQMLKTQPDGQRRQLEGILNGEARTEIYCNSDECQGRHIGFVYNDGSVTSKFHEYEKRMLFRRRFDGKIGIWCPFCGWDSRVAYQEQGIIKDKQPTKQDLLKLRDRFKTNPPTTVMVDENTEEVDGFLFRKVAA